MTSKSAARPIAALRTVIVLAAVVPAIMFAAAAIYLYEQAISQARLRVDRAARIAEEHALKVIETNMALINRVIDIVGDDDSLALIAREHDLHDVMKRMTANLPQLQGIFIIDAAGHMMATNRVFPAPHTLDFTDRAFYQHHRDGGSQPYITDVLTSRTTGELFFDVSLRRDFSDGRFGGAVSTSLTPIYFRDFYRELTGGDENIGISLVRSDGAVLASWPKLPEPSDAGKAPMAMRVAQGEISGGASGLIASRALGDYPVRVVAWTTRSAALAPWHEDLVLLAAVMIPITLSLIYIAWIALRTTRRSLDSLQALQDETAQRQRAEVALQEAQKLEALGRLTGGVAHDFNNLLMVISNNLYLHKRLTSGVSESRELGAIDRAVTAGVKLTHQLLSFSRRKAPHAEAIRLQEKLPAMADLLMPALGSMVSTVVEVDPATHAIEVDAAELELALLNLAINARDAMPTGGTLEIKCRNAPPGEPVAREGAFVVIAVRDTGVGIAPQILPRIFEPFFTTKPIGQGTGLGLSQVYGFCARSGGTAIANSELGQGTEIRMYLPALQTNVRAVEDIAIAPQPNLKDVSVLLVEDNDEVAVTTEAVLEQIGCKVERVASADGARTYLQTSTNHVDVVLSDIVMPGAMNGIGLAEWLRKAMPRLPVVLMSGFSASVAQGEATGLRILSKPVDPASLAQALTEARATR